jgi:CheY-like chemotaxis protein
MPVMNGIESTFKIRALEKERHQKPSTIVALTGLASAEAQQEAFSNGINLFLTKPVRFGELRKLLGEWVPA